MANYYSVKYEDGSYYWYNRDRTALHRIEGPAIESANGDKHWYFNGKLHKNDGPSITGPDRSDAYFLFGTEVSKTLYYEVINTCNKFRALPMSETEFCSKHRELWNYIPRAFNDNIICFIIDNADNRNAMFYYNGYVWVWVDHIKYWHPRNQYDNNLIHKM